MSAATAGTVRIGDAVDRVDGPDKVTGVARYAADEHVEGLLYGWVVSSTAARGRITRIDVDEALSVAGVVQVLTHANRPRMRRWSLLHKDMIAPAGKPFRPLHDDKIHYAGQPLALVVAQSLEAARAAARFLVVHVETLPHDTDFQANLHRARAPSPFKLGYSPPPSEKGDAKAVFAAAHAKTDLTFHASVEHHNPMELFATTVVRDDQGHLTIFDKTQGSQNSRGYVCRAFGLPKRKVTVRNPYVGGAFGAGLRPQYQLALAVMASIALERSVRVVMTRQQMFTFGHRPETHQHVQLGAAADGTLMSIQHDAVTATSRWEDFTESVVTWSGQLYACDNICLGYNVVDLDQFTPLDMRAPGAAHGVHALEVAMDDLAHRLGMDPLALRLKNYAERHPLDDLPFSTKALRACYARGADLFGWSRRTTEPRSMREGHELVGWGMATGTWDAMQMFARATAELGVDGKLVVRSAATDLGTGTYTAMAMIAADAMGMSLEDVRFELGDSNFPMAPVAGGSSHVTTVGSAVDGACEKLKRKVFELAKKLPGSPLVSSSFDEIEFVSGRVSLVGQADAYVALSDLAASLNAPLSTSYVLLPNMLRQRKYARATHSAVFCEVRVDEDLGTVRVTRVVSAIAAGRIINAKAARSQVTGAVVWGIGQALHEETQTDHRLGKFMNHNFAEYHIPVNADIHDIQVEFVHEDDRVVSRLGAKGVGEIGIVGVSAAICNAIFHATGRRLTSLPMTPDKVMRPED